MRILDLYESKQKKGTYAAARLSKATKTKIAKYLKANDISDACSVDDMHCTILYSRKYLDDYMAAGKYDKAIVGTDCKFEIWPNNEKSKNVLVLTVKSPGMTKRHKHLMNKHDATYDFPDYKPHVTFSYDVGDHKAGDFPPIDFDILFDTEYTEELDLD